MRFDVRDTSRFPRPLVFRAHRDELEAIAKFLPDVQKVEVRGRTRHADGVEEHTSLWTGSPSVLPAMIRPMVPPSLLQWQQVTRWDPVAFVASWQIDVPGLGGAVRATGANRYLEVPEGCTIEIDGDFAFRPGVVPQLKAVPASAVPLVERVVVGLVVPMIERSGVAVRQYLESRG